MKEPAAYNMLLSYFPYLSNIRFYAGFLLIGTIVCMLYIHKKLRQNLSVNLPPGPPRLPLLGSLPWINRSNPSASFTQWANQYGSVVAFYMGSEINVIINDAKLARELLIKHADVFQERANLAGARHTFGVKGGVFNENGHDWKTHRRWLVTGLRHFGMGKRSLEEQIRVEASKLCTEIEKEHSNFYPLKYIMNAVSNIICSVSFGKRYEYDDPQFQDLLKNVNAFFNYSHRGRIQQAFPFLVKYFVKKKQYADSITRFVHTHMKEHKDTFDKSNIRDLIDMLLLQVEEESEAGESGSSDIEKSMPSTGKSVYIAGKSVSDGAAYLWRTILTLFIAGTDTTTNTIMWFLLYMVCYPAVQRRVHDEIRNATAGERPLKISDRLLVPYFEATICEVQRLGSIAASLLPHRTTSDFVLNGYDIPANTVFNVNLAFVHTDPKYWNDPFEFKPERFLDADEKTFRKREAFIPFGLGRRACLGESLAKMEIYIFMSSLLQRFNFELPELSPRPSFEPITGITQSPQYFEVVAKPRNTGLYTKLSIIHKWR
ncbi:cytochrome P450 2J5-like [Anneissia japonica]|uniref:cytochrome P450 2J5-like n=1 Tax=Anneissia japonica TaxID=1529436 RepID=UPI0014256A0F|nr:cytochrome P450 2J5-like [Anneissia japonica]